jgi:hypothetical protein
MSHTPSAIYLYDDPDSPGLDVDALALWLQQRLPLAHVEPRSDYLTHHLGRFGEQERELMVEQLAARLEEVEIHNLVHPDHRERLPAEDPAESELDVVYDGRALQALLGLLVPEAESGRRQVHIAFTSNYLGRWSVASCYLELQVGFLGRPNLLTTSGLIEALALPRRYHFMRQQLATLGADDWLDDLSVQFADHTLGYGDPRLNEVCKGYVLQAVVYCLTGEVGCVEKACRLHLGATHEETLATHTGAEPGLCGRHEALLKSWGGVPE